MTVKAFALATVFAALAGASFADTAVAPTDTGTFDVATTQGMDNREDRRDGRQDNRDDRQDNRQDCRGAEGVGADKRDCKQDARQVG